MRLKHEDPDQLVKIVSDILHSYGVDVIDAADGIEYILDSDLWQYRDPSPGLLEPRQYDFFPQFCEDVSPWGLRTSYATVIDVCRRNDRVYLKVVEAGKQEHGSNRYTQKEDVYNINVYTPTKGTSKAYGLSRLKRHRPDLYELVEAGEMSTHEAMIEAGYRDKTYTVKAEPECLANFIKKNMDKAQIKELINLLKL